jgi:hypothetical protein
MHSSELNGAAGTASIGKSRGNLTPSSDYACAIAVRNAGMASSNCFLVNRALSSARRAPLLFVIKSPFGISQAVIERQEDTWPKAVVLRRHLKGLSSFRASNGKVTLNVAASIEEGKTQVRIWKDSKEDAPLDEQSPL